MKRTPAISVALLISLYSVAAAEDWGARYLRDIKPLLRQRCIACHGALKQESGLRLDTVALMLRGGESGPAILPGNVAESALVERIAADDSGGRMPPEGKPLAPQEITTIRAWVAAGAVAPLAEQPEEDPRSHWSFRAPTRPEHSPVDAIADGSNPIDAWVGSRLRREQLEPRPQAEKPVLLRRLYLDVIGVPPTPEELRSFLEDPSPSAWVDRVDRLLNDPRYGERWARHWMDIWRYSDWYGRRYVPDVWNSAPQIWRWRDWIVESINGDKGYDRMLAEMLAADELCPEDREAGYATGYLVRNWYALNPNDWMRANVEHTGKAFLGLTFNCAHCHDHKYDPISHEDYFRLRAYFEPIAIRQDRVPGQPDPGPFQEYEYSKLRTVQRLGAVRIFDKNVDAPTWFYTGGDERNRVEQRGSLPPGLPTFLADSLPAEASGEIPPIRLPPRAWYPGLQPEIQQTVRSEATNALSAATAKLAAVRRMPAATASQATQALAAAEAAYDLAAAQGRNSGQPGALVGQQSLVLDASSGRRALQNQGQVQKLERLPDGSQFEFQLQILADAHVNFQLAKNVDQGLTAVFVGFDRGRILSYQPGGFTEFEVGRYAFASGQRRFHVTLVLQTAADRCLLSVRSVPDGTMLAADVPVALNGWNPVGDNTKGITFDARTGAVAVLDHVTLTTPPAGSTAPGGERLLTLDFEPPKYGDGKDVLGIDGFAHSSLSVAPATSYVSVTAANEQLRDLSQRIVDARRAVENITLPMQAAEAEVAAATARLASVEATIAADNAKYAETPGADGETLARAASLAERQAVHLRAQSDVLVQQLALLLAEAKSLDDQERAKQIAAASEALAQARTQVDATRSGTTGPDGSLEYAPLSPIYPSISSGRRRALAEWITGRQNPLTARVAINHIWLRHFHAPLVSTVDDFGRNGALPTHPQLLDWLAVELMESGWSMKHIHRLILTSQVWQRVTSTGDARSPVEKDPENRLLWRMNTGRMEAEVLRDSLLHCAGKLDFALGGQELENSAALTTHRRSLYYSAYPEEGGTSRLAQLFDAPSPLECYRRTESIVPQQALALTNSDLVHEVSEAMVAGWETALPDRVLVPDDAESQEQRFIVEMFQWILSREPSVAESAACRAALAAQRELLRTAHQSDSGTAARASLVRALLNHNDFVTIR